MSSRCPNDNSNEAIACLLRQVDDNTRPDWNWDPLNFAVTAAIGILALIIACITVFQQLLAAGPGRLKASKLAIGPFSVHSRSRFDRTEIALRTTARVPLITWDVVFHRIVRQKFRPRFDDPNHPHRNHRRPITPGEAEVDEVYGGTTAFGTTSVNARHQYDSTATWLTLLTALGLDDPTFFPLVQRVTDYLPADIQAAPAAVELRCLAILAAIADDNAVIEAAGPSSRFVTVNADSSQLSFRDHPSMGAVAAYEAYEETAMLKVGDSPPLQFGSTFSTMKFDDLDRCLQLASGRLAYANGRLPQSIDGEVDERGFMNLVRDLTKRSAGCKHDICAHAYQDWVGGIDGLQQRKKAWHLLKGLKNVYMAVSLLAGDRANLCRAFPRTKMNLSQAFRDVLALDEFWSTDMTWMKVIQMQRAACLTFWSVRCIPFGSRIPATWVADLKTIQTTVLNPFTSVFKARQEFKEDKTMQLIEIIRAFVTRQTNPTDPNIEEIEHSTIQARTLAQLLTCMDEWLLRKGGSHASCAMLRLMYKLGSQNNLLLTHREDFQQKGLLAEMATDTITNEKGKVYHHSAMLAKGSIDSTKSLQIHHLIDDLDISMMLVFRGVLMALLLNQGADTSILYEPEFRDSVVRIL